MDYHLLKIPIKRKKPQRDSPCGKKRHKNTAGAHFSLRYGHT